jgi:hypothetical protein
MSIMKITLKTLIIALLIVLWGCEVDYYDNPNNPSTPPSSAVFNNTVFNIVNQTRDTWWMGRFTLNTMQYWQQAEYGDEDRYAYREAQRQNGWVGFYGNLQNLKIVIELNENPATKAQMEAYGANQNQIACARIMMAYMFHIMVDTWGDIPYWSHGSNNPNFQALQLTGANAIIYPKYAPQSEIYADLLKELQEAEAQLDATKSGFKSGDNIFKGDVVKWKKFANSLRLKIALKVRGVAPQLANPHITDAIAKGVIMSNADNAMFKYENVDKNANPIYRAWNVDKRKDFAVSNTFVTLLKGENIMGHDKTAITTAITNNPFPGLVDPRLAQFADKNPDGNYVGMPVPLTSGDAATITWKSYPSTPNITSKPDFAVSLLEYSEIAFILSELNGWDQTHYTNGIKASMEKWGVPTAQIDTYVAAVPAANQENVLTQKYIALYMDSQSAWSEYRRTGYPKVLMKPGNYAVYEPKQDKHFLYEFLPIPTEITNDLPKRMQYPVSEQTLNTDSWKEAVNRYAGKSDNLVQKLWWQP